ncbi:MAG: mycofactocin precursor MftA [Thermomicrobium sp.]|nr:mycofactocin precursor MftA [Thermomicrobium sp.]
MEPVVDVEAVVEEPALVVDEVQGADRKEEESAEQLVEMLLKEITIDGMCGVY